MSATMLCSRLSSGSSGRFDPLARKSSDSGIDIISDSYIRVSIGNTRSCHIALEGYIVAMVSFDG